MVALLAHRRQHVWMNIGWWRPLAGRAATQRAATTQHFCCSITHLIAHQALLSGCRVSFELIDKDTLSIGLVSVMCQKRLTF